jgi:hypothetical protein
MARDTLNRMRTTPVPVQRTTRRHDLRVLTSLPAGKMVPLAAIPLLREDSLTRGMVRVDFEMAETVEVLMNAINVRVMAYLVPNLAFERFTGMDSLNRSYEGVPEREGEPVIPYFESMPAPAHGANQVLTYMGKHFRPGTTINAAYIEAYNAIWNLRANNRSPDIARRERLDGTLAPAFWQHSNFHHIVPDFDQAVIDGEVALNVVNSKMPIRGLGIGNNNDSVDIGPIAQGGGLVSDYAAGWKVTDAAAPITGETNLYIKRDLGYPAQYVPDVWAELQDNGITVSLSNLDMARRTQAFANLRKQYSGHTDDFIIDLLMDGITVPEQAWRRPILLADRNTVFGMSKRYASDAGNLTESVVSGITSLDVSFSVPKCPTGGVVMLVAEITPEQLFERQKDPYLHATNVEFLPQFLRDTLDPEKVSVVKNEYVDLDHDQPEDTFGYAPLNHEWTHTSPQIGGRFYRPAVDASFDEDRQRIWAVETQNPVLSQDFYLCTTMHTKPFVVTNQDPFEAVARGDALIRGNTVFGGLLVEATNDYAEVVAEQPTARIIKPA